jgi:hypothetical protein
MRIIGFGCDGDLNLTSVTVEEDGREYRFENPRWISVEERLPEGEGWVLAIGLLLKKKKGGNYGWSVPHVAEYRHGRWCDLDGMMPDLEDRSLKITHWMPLPEPPKEAP